MLRVFAVAAVCACLIGTSASGADPFLWLEDVNGARALTWVKAENAKTLAVLRGDPHFKPFYADALAINGSRDRIPTPQIVDGRVYNFWQDAGHARGIWRTTTLADYARRAPAWETVLDLDALARAEGKNWVWQDADCDSPGRRRCLISLSEGGEDAATIREFDLPTRRFPSGGFVLPRGKQTAVWEDDRTLLVSREWQPGELTTSGYPYIVKRLHRGESLAAAIEVYRGTKADVHADPFELHDRQGRRALLIDRGRSFFESEERLLTPGGVVKLNIPRKAALSALVAGRLVVKLSEPWKAGARTFAQGSLASFELAAAASDPQHLKPSLIFRPGPRETLGDVAASGERLLVTTYENVRGRAALYLPSTGGGWARRRLAFPDNASLDIVSTDDAGSAAFVSVTGYLTPTTLWRVDTRTARLAVVKSLPALFDASGEVVEQDEAVSKDGTLIPYFVMRPKRMRRDGANPTVLYAYGGFAVSLTPAYSAARGKLWLANGGVYVVANIRGGGEFGPAWHEAGLKTKRQRIYDDFAAVAKKLISSKVTSPRRLGIAGAPTAVFSWG